MSAAGKQPRLKKTLSLFHVSVFFKVSPFESFFFFFVLNHRVLHFYLERSTYDDARGFFSVQSVVFLFAALPHFCRFANRGAFCSHRRCLHVYFNYFFSPAARLRSTAPTTAGAVCAYVCAYVCVCSASKQ